MTYSSDAHSVYVHVPFCLHHCGYCDFSVTAGRDDLIPRYLEALRLEMQSLPANHSIHTLHIGGGTPTQLSTEQLRQLLALLRSKFKFEDNAEFCVEANPDGFEIDKQHVLEDYGVNRISLGVQSFDSDPLQFLERTHNRAHIYDLMSQLADRFSNISLDLIYALPDQSLDHWENTIREALQLGPNHISCYQLTIEKGTTFYGRRLKGDILELDSEDSSRMYESAMTLLPESGFHQYEISNFAQPGYESEHNQVYWLGHPYLAFGPGASRFVNGVRSTNHRSLMTWMRRLEENLSPVAEIDRLSPEERARELLAVGLRRTAGVSKDRFESMTGFPVDDLLETADQTELHTGWLIDAANNLKLSKEGRFFADTVASVILSPTQEGDR